jgi:rhodanese-related sulfurtransferase
LHCALSGERPTISDVAPLAYDDSPVESPVAEIEAEELETTLRGALLLDVREPHEAVLGSIDGAIRIPASELEARMHELDSALQYVVACRVGAKSLWAVRRLRDAGFTRLVHLHGGLLAYAVRHEDFEFF